MELIVNKIDLYTFARKRLKPCAEFHRTGLFFKYLFL